MAASDWDEAGCDDYDDLDYEARREARWEAEQAKRAAYESQCCPVCRADAVQDGGGECLECEARVCRECGAWRGGVEQAVCDCDEEGTP